MKIKIEYKSDTTSIPYCAYTTINGKYHCEWSAKSFEDAKQLLIKDLKTEPPMLPPPEEIEIP